MRHMSVLHPWFSNSRSLSKSALLAPLPAVSHLQHALPLCMHRAALQTCVCLLYALSVVANSLLFVYGGVEGMAVRAESERKPAFSRPV